MTIANVSGLTKPQKLQSVIQKASAYISTMQALGKPVDHVAISAPDYDAIYRAVEKNRAENDPKVVGLRINDVRLDRA